MWLAILRSRARRLMLAILRSTAHPRILQPTSKGVAPKISPHYQSSLVSKSRGSCKAPAPKIQCQLFIHDAGEDVQSCFGIDPEDPVDMDEACSWVQSAAKKLADHTPWSTKLMGVRARLTKPASAKGKMRPPEPQGPPPKMRPAEPKGCPPKKRVTLPKRVTFRPAQPDVPPPAHLLKAGRAKHFQGVIKLHRITWQKRAKAAAKAVPPLLVKKAGAMMRAIMSTSSSSSSSSSETRVMKALTRASYLEDFINIRRSLLF